MDSCHSLKPCTVNSFKINFQLLSLQDNVIFLLLFSARMCCLLAYSCFRKKWLLPLSSGRCRFWNNSAAIPGENEALLPSLQVWQWWWNQIFWAIKSAWQWLNLERNEAVYSESFRCPQAQLNKKGSLGLMSPSHVLRGCQSIRATDTWLHLLIPEFISAHGAPLSWPGVRVFPAGIAPVELLFQFWTGWLNCSLSKTHWKWCFSSCSTPPSVIGRELEPSSRKSLESSSEFSCGWTSIGNFSPCAWRSCSVHFCFTVSCGNLGNPAMETAWHRVLKQD